MPGSFVGLQSAMCPVCGRTFETGALLVHTHLREIFPRSGKTPPRHYELCPEHAQKHKEGFIALVGVDPERSSGAGSTLKMEDAYRTGRILHLKAEVWGAFINTELERLEDGTYVPMVFVEDGAIDLIEKRFNALKQKGETDGPAEPEHSDRPEEAQAGD